MLAVPVQTVRASLELWGHEIPKHALVLSLAKGIEDGTDLRVSQIVHRVASIEPERIAVLSGPNLAGEIILREPAAPTVACPDGDPMTFLGLAGVGDLIATCASPLSRNRTFGVHLGKGRSVSEVISTSRLTCEAVKSCRPIVDLAKAHDIEMPIAALVTQIVHENAPAGESMRRYFSNEGGAEQTARGFFALAKARFAGIAARGKH